MTPIFITHLVRMRRGAPSSLRGLNQLVDIKRFSSLTRWHSREGWCHESKERRSKNEIRKWK